MPADVSVEASAQLLSGHCANCHGPAGDGDSPVGRALVPAANDLTDPALYAAVEDDFLFWRIKEGGAFQPFNSGMEPFKDRLDEEQTCQVIAYIRSLAK